MREHQGLLNGRNKPHILEYGLDCNLMDHPASYSPSLEQEVHRYCTWLQLVDVWFLLHAWHTYTSKCVFLIIAVAASLAIGGFIMQTPEPLPLLPHTAHSNHLSLRDSYTNDRYQCHSRLHTFCVELQTLHGEHEANIKEFHTELKALRDATDMTRKHIDEIKSLVQYVKTDASKMEVAPSLNKEASIQKLIEDELAKYDADKLGIPDYALESSGGSIVATPDTRIYKQMTWVTLWGIRLFTTGTNSPRNIIQASLQPGNCWAFEGSRGTVIIKLSARIHITAVTLEHIPQRISTTGNINSAPKMFAVFGLKHDSNDKDHLGYFTYDINGSPTQTFEVIQKAQQNYSFQAVELSVLSNHGNLDYTCIYRFRVHGTAATNVQI
ncbi:SUN domain-containing protein 1 isoform X2 [Cryptotermes secundus]|uniref:SUN domain-containing protein 1 isoform X2 n=1 Tax=Cryptotermes secundus TaxID=105785 RepID=UPI000CD7CAD5|nr:SUN domain-containing protein 1 isoform X2 [Cryptotermes secundus]